MASALFVEVVIAPVLAIVTVPVAAWPLIPSPCVTIVPWLAIETFPVVVLRATMPWLVPPVVVMLPAEVTVTCLSTDWALMASAPLPASLCFRSNGR